MLDEAVVRRGAAPLVRPAAVADARRIGAIHVRSWRATYAGHLPEGLLESLDAKALAEDMIRALTSRRPRRAVLVVEAGRGPVRKVVGFAAIGPAREESAAGIDGPIEDVAQLFMIYVDPRWIRRGLGRALHDAIMEVSQTFNYRKAILWVLPTNAGARAFYESQGWTCDGAEQTEELDGYDIPEIRYVRDV
jgi:ribosomal protein S18 acetylase RimI-like enzyme